MRISLNCFPFFPFVSIVIVETFVEFLWKFLEYPFRVARPGQYKLFQFLAHSTSQGCSGTRFYGLDLRQFRFQLRVVRRFMLSTSILHRLSINEWILAWISTFPCCRWLSPIAAGLFLFVSAQRLFLGWLSVFFFSRSWVILDMYFVWDSGGFRHIIFSSFASKKNGGCLSSFYFPTSLLFCFSFPYIVLSSIWEAVWSNSVLQFLSVFALHYVIMLLLFHFPSFMWMDVVVIIY